MRSNDLPARAALAGATQDLLASFASLFTSHQRLFTLSFPADSGIASELNTITQNINSIDVNRVSEKAQSDHITRH